MSAPKAFAPILVAALLIAVAGPALAKKQSAGETSSAQTQSKGKGKQDAKACNRVTPPYMHNPRFMNRGFFKPSWCRKQSQ